MCRNRRLPSFLPLPPPANGSRRRPFGRGGQSGDLPRKFCARTKRRRRGGGRPRSLYHTFTAYRAGESLSECPPPRRILSQVGISPANASRVEGHREIEFKLSRLYACNIIICMGNSARRHFISTKHARGPGVCSTIWLHSSPSPHLPPEFAVHAAISRSQQSTVCPSVGPSSVTVTGSAHFARAREVL